MIAQAHELLAEAEHGEGAAPPGADHVLVPHPFGLERRAATALVRDGTLSTTKIGRRIYTTRAALAALVGNVPDVARPALSRVEPPARASAAEEYGRVVALAGRGRGRPR